MTREICAPTSPSPAVAQSKFRQEGRKPVRDTRKASRITAVALTGGSVLACVALVIVVTARHRVQTPAAVFASGVSVTAEPAMRLAASAAPTQNERFPRLSARVMSPPPPQPSHVQRPVASQAAPKRPALTPVESHRLDVPDVAEATRFVPTAALPIPAVNTKTLAIAPAAQADHRMLASLSSTGAGFAHRVGTEPEVKVEVASLAPVAVASPLPKAVAEEPAPPRTALAALEEQLALSGVPTPTARPFQDTVRTASRELTSREPAPAPRQRNRAPAGLLAYARPDAGSIADEPAVLASPVPVTPRLNAGTAIYDIAAATVYLPSGERLEAHSGLGSMRDDVRFVRERNRGPTPPHTYDLTLRESLFHGVQAIRLNPVGGERNIHNRVGLLAHTYMLGPRGDSNGCVSVKDYKRFLAAFRRGEIRRLVVVPSMNNSATSRLASLFRSRG